MVEGPPSLSRCPSLCHRRVRLWLDQDWSRAPPIPVRLVPNPEDSVRRWERQPVPFTVKQGELAEDGVLNCQGGAGTSHTSEVPENQKGP